MSTRVVIKRLVQLDGKKRSELEELNLGSVQMESVPRAKGSLVFFNDKLYKIYKSFDWVYLNDDGNEQHYVELILDSKL
jgi:hypothetical protein